LPIGPVTAASNQFILLAEGGEAGDERVEAPSGVD
jgi:hypothetical protein